MAKRPTSRSARFRRSARATGARARQRGERDRAGADHGRAARGHLALVRAGAAPGRPRRGVDLRQSAQFAPHEDFASYPRTLDDRPRGAGRSQGRSGLGAARPRCIRRASRPGSRRKAPPWPGWRTSSARISSAASPPWWPSCSCKSRPISRCSARRTTSSSRSSPQMAQRPRPAGQGRSACRPCARRTASRCRRATPTSRRPSARSRRRSTACSRNARRASRTASRSARRARRRPRREIERAGFALDYLEARHAETLAPIAVAQGRPDPAPGRGQARHATRMLIDNDRGVME